MSNKVFTYHEVMPSHADQTPLLALWAEGWRKRGWEPVVLDNSHARQHPKYNEHYQRFYDYPTVNPKPYEMACYLRWLAFEAVGGGYMTDADVMNYNFHVPQEVGVPTIHDPHGVPCMVSASAKHAHEIADFLFNSTHVGDYNGRPHTSDMIILQTSPFKRLSTCIEYLIDDWDRADCVHWASGPTRRAQGHLDKAKVIQMVRPV